MDSDGCSIWTGVRETYSLIVLRESWVLSYVLCSNGVNSIFNMLYIMFLKGIYSAQTCLRKFSEQVYEKLFCVLLTLHSYCIGVELWTDPWILLLCRSAFLQLLEEGHIYEEMQSIRMSTGILIEALAQNILTPCAFRPLSMHWCFLCIMPFLRWLLVSLVHHLEKMDGERFVIWIPEAEQVHCSSKEFESSEILCNLLF